MAGSTRFVQGGKGLMNEQNMHAAVLSRRLKAKYLEIRSRQNIDVLLHRLPFSTRVQSHKVNMGLALPGDSEKVWQGLKSSVRSQVRKAEKNGLTFKRAVPAAIDAFYKIFSRNMRDLGSPVHSKKWIQAILENYGNMAGMGLIFYRKMAIGGAVMLASNKRVCIPWASSIREFNRLGTNMLLYWNLVKYASDSGFSVFDFGRSTYGEGTYRFKSQWGAQPAPIYWYTIQLDGKHRLTETPESPGRRLAGDLWKRLPAPIAAFLGPYIRKHISL